MRLDLAAVAAHEPETVADQPRDAAVLIPVLQRGDRQALVFIKRSEDLGEHPGQMSFPGGGTEPIDTDLRATALREADEEIGLDPSEASLVGQLDDIRTVSEYAVTPFVATVPDRPYTPDGVEATEVAVLAVEDLADPAHYEWERREHPEHGVLPVHYFHVDGYTVWGATGRILADLLALSTDWSTPVRSDVDVA